MSKKNEEPITTCPNCDHLLLNTSKEHSLCPKGCGGLFPAVPKETNAMTLKTLKKVDLPEASKVFRTLPEDLKSDANEIGFIDTFVYVIEGREGFWRRVRRESKSTTRENGNVVAVDTSKMTIELAQFNELDEWFECSGWCFLSNESEDHDDEIEVEEEVDEENLQEV